MKGFAILFLSLFILSSCRHTTGSGVIVTETRKVNDFNAVSVGGGFEVEIRIGAVTSVVVEADDNIMEYISITSNNNTLKIGTEDLHNYSDVHMKVLITTPALVSIKGSASAKVIVEDVLTGTNRLIFKASSGASIQAEIDAPMAESDASSGASVKISGKTRQYSAEASSGAEIKSFDLLSENTTVNASSGASAAVHASVTLNASASSGASITYQGGAKVTPNISSGGSINKRN
jgi:Putative auto-transporter adhesin, head GIN domain